VVEEFPKFNKSAYLYLAMGYSKIGDIASAISTVFFSKNKNQYLVK